MILNDFKVEQWMNDHEKDAVYNLTDTCAVNLTLDQLLELETLDFSEIVMDYGDITGDTELKKEILSLYTSGTIDQITTTHGCIQANELVMATLLEKGDHVITCIPGYQQFSDYPRSIGCTVSELMLNEEKGWMIDIQDFVNAIQDNTKMIILNNPNNPTGTLMKDEFLLKLVHLAKDKGIYILCDEVYKELNQKEYFSSSIADLYENGISVCSMSKTFSLAGLRLGWLASKNKKIIKSCMHHREYNMISCSMIDEEIAALALTKSEEIISQNKKILSENLEILDNWIQSQEHFKYIKPQAGTTALLYYDFDVPSKEFCHRLSTEKGVFTTPGFCFELEYCFRIGYGKDKKIFSEGLKKISEFAEENRGLYDTRILK